MINKTLLSLNWISPLCYCKHTHAESTSIVSDQYTWKLSKRITIKNHNNLSTTFTIQKCITKFGLQIVAEKRSNYKLWQRMDYLFRSRKSWPHPYTILLSFMFIELNFNIICFYKTIICLTIWYSLRCIIFVALFLDLVMYTH